MYPHFLLEEQDILLAWEDAGVTFCCWANNIVTGSCARESAKINLSSGANELLSSSARRSNSVGRGKNDRSVRKVREQWKVERDRRGCLLEVHVCQYLCTFPLLFLIHLRPYWCHSCNGGRSFWADGAASLPCFWNDIERGGNWLKRMQAL